MSDHQQQKSTGHAGAGVPASVAVRPSERSEHIRYAIRDILRIAEVARAAG